MRAISRSLPLLALGMLLVAASSWAAEVSAAKAVKAAVERGKALLAANLSYSTVVFASLAGGWLWGEAHTLLAWAGIALIIAAGMVMGALSRRAEPMAAD